jgi:alpha-beta hydrolase superfamily lysophospholipase
VSTWDPDLLGSGFERRVIDLGKDPDGEGDIVATLVRHRPENAIRPAPRGAVLYAHGFTDYFFQRHLAEHFTARGYAFYALDLRKCGRSRMPGQTAHFVTNLALYDVELNAALRIIRAEPAVADAPGGPRVLVAAHSTGGLITPLWLDRLNRLPGGARSSGITGLVLNSPWFDLQGPWYLRSLGTAAVDAIGRTQPFRPVGRELSEGYGASLHLSQFGEWDYDLALKPLSGFQVTYGWLRAIRRGHAELHKGLDIGVPSLILRSTRTQFSSRYRAEMDTADAVLDVRQIAKWAGCLGDRTSIVPIKDARHDVFLSLPGPRAAAFAELDAWLDWHETATPSEAAFAAEEASREAL